MPENVIIAYKNLGETPLESLEKARLEHSIDPSVPMTYAGRLDPMAEGLLILLAGEECKNKDKYLGLDKTYEFEVLVGFETDTYDLLGLVASSADKISGPRVGSPDTEILPTDFASALKSFMGTFIQKYPSFSSKTVLGKQLFQLSKDDESPGDMPEHEVTIRTFTCTGSRVISREELHTEIVRRISLVRGDFRQNEIIERWNESMTSSSSEKFTIFSCTAECSSGTYIRQLVHDIGQKLETPLVTFSIRRTNVGPYTIA